MASPVLAVVGKGGGHRLAPPLRAEMEAGFGADFSDVRIHTDASAATSAAAVAAKAYTVGNEVVFGHGSFDPGRTEGKQLLAHELTHVLQQRQGQLPTAGAGREVAVSDPSDPIEQQAEATAIRMLSRPGSRTLPRAAPAPLTSRLTIARQVAGAATAPAPPNAVSGPAGLPAGVSFRVVIVGSPGENEVKLNHPFQFADAAAEQGTGATTVWLVERTGYERGKVPVSGIQQRAGKATVFWIDESHSLSSLLSQFRPGSIGQLEAYSHGTPGLLALRHGWPGVEDYGLTTAQAKALSPKAFTDDARISFDSCNSGTPASGEPSLAQAVADATGHPVEGWTGRISYHDVNVAAASGTPHAPAEVKRSDVLAEGGVDWTEVLSRVEGRRPVKETFAPESSPGSFTSWFSITARLPSSRVFPVPKNGSVDVKVQAWSEFQGIQGGAVTALLHRQTGGLFSGDTEMSGRLEVLIGGDAQTYTWTNLAAGSYFVEIYHLAGYLVEGSVSVSIH
jgi:Domain of unknown function (DUF4157)